MLASRFLVPISASLMASGTLLIALRIHVSNYEWSVPGVGLDPGNLTLGLESAQWEHMWLTIIGRNATDWLMDLFRLLTCIGALLLYQTQRNRDEYLWLFLGMLCVMPNTVVGVLSLTHAMPMRWWKITQIASLPYVYFFVRMYCSFFGHRVGWKLQAATIFATAAVGYRYLREAYGAPSYRVQWLAFTPFFLLSVIVLPALLIP